MRAWAFAVEFACSVMRTSLGRRWWGQLGSQARPERVINLSLAKACIPQTGAGAAQLAERGWLAARKRPVE